MRDDLSRLHLRHRRVVFNNGQYIAIGGEDCVKQFNLDPAAYLNESLRLDPTAPPNYVRGKT